MEQHDTNWPHPENVQWASSQCWCMKGACIISCSEWWTVDQLCRITKHLKIIVGWTVCRTGETARCHSYITERGKAVYVYVIKKVMCWQALICWKEDGRNILKIHNDRSNKTPEQDKLLLGSTSCMVTKLI